MDYKCDVIFTLALEHTKNTLPATILPAKKGIMNRAAGFVDLEEAFIATFCRIEHFRQTT
jgi:hypothetical protein